MTLPASLTTSGGHCCTCLRTCMHIGGPWFCDSHKPKPAGAWNPPHSSGTDPGDVYPVMAAERDQLARELIAAERERDEAHRAAVKAADESIMDRQLLAGAEMECQDLRARLAAYEALETAVRAWLRARRLPFADWTPAKERAAQDAVIAALAALLPVEQPAPAALAEPQE